jgi:putative redox protein
MDNVRVRWVRGRQFVGWDRLGHGVVMDAPGASTDELIGARPIELVLYALGGCTGVDVASVLAKKRLDVRGIDISVSGVQREDEFPHSYETIDIHYTVTGVSVPASAVERAIELSQTKYCSVKGMFGPQVSITTSFEVVEPPAPGPSRIDEGRADV